MAGDVIDITDVDALPRTATALTAHSAELRGVVSELASTSAKLEDQVERVLSGLRAGVDQAKAALAAVDPEDRAARAAAAAALALAERKLDAALIQQGILRRTLTTVTRSVTAETRGADRIIATGVGRLMALWAGLGRTLSTFHMPPSSSPAPTPAAPAELTRVGSAQHRMVDVSAIDASDSGVRGPEDFTKVSAEEMRAGLLLLERVILPAVSRGEGIEDMRARDTAARAAGGSADHVRVYEAFFGDSAIKLARAADGGLTVINGYHRIWLARRIGVERLPAEVRDVP
ncbi:MAG TPA: hypothetical protein VM677_28185 [Actinokineospora sp.]|nr:hypothetical protein [Actinokineospora sp.]